MEMWKCAALPIVSVKDFFLGVSGSVLCSVFQGSVLLLGSFWVVTRQKKYFTLTCYWTIDFGGSDENPINSDIWLYLFSASSICIVTWKNCYQRGKHPSLFSYCRRLCFFGVKSPLIWVDTCWLYILPCWLILHFSKITESSILAITFLVKKKQKHTLLV